MDTSKPEIIALMKSKGMCNEKWTNPLMTTHAFKRIKQRFGVKNKDNARKLVKKALNLGDKVKWQGRRRILRYQNMAFVFVGRTVVTAYDVPLRNTNAQMVAMVDKQIATIDYDWIAPAIIRDVRLNG
jgi:hypothetical protein